MPQKTTLLSRVLFLCGIIALPLVTSAQNWPMFHQDKQNTGVSLINKTTPPLKIWPAVVYQVAGDIFSSPALYNVDNDSACEIFFGTRVGSAPTSGGSLYGLKYSNQALTLLYQKPSPGGYYFASSPAVGVVGTPNIPALFIGCQDGKVYGFNATNGSSLSGWPYTTSGSIWSSPNLGDLCNGNSPNVVIGSYDKHVYAIKGNGSLLWNYNSGDSISCKPALGDMNNDSYLDVVFGTFANSLGKVVCLDGNTGCGGGLITTIWSRSLPSKGFSPALAKLNQDNILDVVIGCGDGRVYFLDGSSGSDLWLPFNTGKGQVVSATPALADLDKDGNVDVVVGSYSNKVYALDGSTGSLSTAPTTLWEFTTGEDVLSSAAIADFDGNTYLDVAVGSSDGRLYIIMCGEKPTPMTSPPQYGVLYTIAYELNAPIYSSPAVGELDGDGIPEIVVGTQRVKGSSNGYLVVIDCD